MRFSSMYWFRQYMAGWAGYSRRTMFRRRPPAPRRVWRRRDGSVVAMWLN